MPKKPSTSPTENATPIRSTTELGALVRATRRAAGLDQESAAGLAGVGARFLGDLERGKPTVRVGLVLQVLAHFGLEVTVSRRTRDRVRTSSRARRVLRSVAPPPR